jgi:deoxyribose-phosphate aldolase
MNVIEELKRWDKIIDKELKKNVVVAVPSGVIKKAIAELEKTPAISDTREMDVVPNYSLTEEQIKKIVNQTINVVCNAIEWHGEWKEEYTDDLVCQIKNDLK